MCASEKSVPTLGMYLVLWVFILVADVITNAVVVVAILLRIFYHYFIIPMCQCGICQIIRKYFMPNTLKMWMRKIRI